SAQRVVEAETHPGQRDVVAEDGARPHPPELRSTEPMHARIVHDVVAIVPVEEVTGDAGPEGEHGGREDEDAQPRGEEPGASCAHRGRPFRAPPMRSGKAPVASARPGPSATAG